MKIRGGSGARWCAFAGAMIALLAVRCGDEDSVLAPDVTPPAVVIVEPADGALAVPAEILPVRVHFDEPVRVPDLSSSLVVRNATEELAGSVALDSTATILTFLPSAPLAAATDYTVTLGAGIADAGGNVRPDSVVTRFSTAFAFYSVGRLFTANQLSHNVTVLDVRTDVPVPGSPVPIAGQPMQLAVDVEAAEVYVLYEVTLNVGILVLDGITLAIERNSGPILPLYTIDLALDPERGLVFAVGPESNTLHVLRMSDLTVAREPYVFPRVDAAPVRVEVASDRDYVLVALDGGAQLMALRLPDLTPVPGFPVPSVPRANSIKVDGPRGRAWVAGQNRYAVVDLIQPARTQSFQMPACGCSSLWSMILDLLSDRVYFLDRNDFVLAVQASNLEPVPESPGRVRFFGLNQDIVQDPRTGDLIIIAKRNLNAPMVRMRRANLEAVGSTLQVIGDNPLDAEVLP
jgi:hypothetical protein